MPPEKYNFTGSIAAKTHYILAKKRNDTHIVFKIFYHLFKQCRFREAAEPDLHYFQQPRYKYIL